MKNINTTAVEQQTIYTQEEQETCVYGKSLDINPYDYDILDDLQLRNTNLDELETTEGIDLEALHLARALRQGVDVPTQDMLDNALDLSDCLSVCGGTHDSHKHTVLKVYANGDKLIANEEGNFIENAVQECDKCDWMHEQEVRDEEKSRQDRYERILKALHKTIRDEPKVYKECYDKQQLLYKVKQYSRGYKFKRQGDEHFKLFMKCSSRLDQLKELEAQESEASKQYEDDVTLHLYVTLQQLLPDNQVEKLDPVKIRNMKFKDRVVYMNNIYKELRRRGLAD